MIYSTPRALIDYIRRQELNDALNAILRIPYEIHN